MAAHSKYIKYIYTTDNMYIGIQSLMRLKVVEYGLKYYE